MSDSGRGPTKPETVKRSINATRGLFRLLDIKHEGDQKLTEEWIAANVFVKRETALRWRNTINGVKNTNTGHPLGERLEAVIELRKMVADELGTDLNGKLKPSFANGARVKNREAEAGGQIPLSAAYLKPENSNVTTFGNSPAGLVILAIKGMSEPRQLISVIEAASLRLHELLD